MLKDKHRSIRIRPKEKGGCNDMIISKSEGDSDIGVKYELHHWHKNLDCLIVYLQDMVNELTNNKNEINKFIAGKN